MSHKVTNCHDSWTVFHLSRVQRKPNVWAKLPASCNFNCMMYFSDLNFLKNFSNNLHCLSEKRGKNPGMTAKLLALDSLTLLFLHAVQPRVVKSYFVTTMNCPEIFQFYNRSYFIIMYQICQPFQY